MLPSIWTPPNGRRRWYTARPIEQSRLPPWLPRPQPTSDAAGRVSPTDAGVPVVTTPDDVVDKSLCGRSQPRFIATPCPLCGQPDREPHLSTGDTTFGFPGTFHVVRCRACTMLYTHPQVTPDDLGRFYPETYPAHLPDRPVRHETNPRRRDPWERLSDLGDKRLLDVGCGSGTYLMRQKHRGWTVLGVEPAAAAARAARKHGLEVIQGVIPGVTLPEHPFEVITMLGVLDHVPEPLATLRVLRRHLTSWGQLIVSVPNAASAAAKRFGPDWPGWDLPRHQNHFTPTTLANMIQKAGFPRVRLLFKRRTSRWQQGARLRAAATGAIGWRILSRSRACCSTMAAVCARYTRRDEIIAVATVD